MPQTVLHPLAPLITAESHTLILGTMPSPRSRAETFYYAHPQNRFWPVIAALYGEEDPKTSEGRAELLLSHGLALWDVLASCTITGAADSTIRDPIPNDIPGLLRQYPGITRIAATGSTAAQLYRRLVEPQAGLPAIGLPMISALAHTDNAVFLTTDGTNFCLDRKSLAVSSLNQLSGLLYILSDRIVRTIKHDGRETSFDALVAAFKRAMIQMQRNGNINVQIL